MIRTRLSLKYVFLKAIQSKIYACHPGSLIPPVLFNQQKITVKEKDQAPHGRLL